MQHRVRPLSLILCLAVLCVAGSGVPHIGAATSPSPAPMASGDWLQKGRNPRKTGFNRQETTIGSSNVSQLVPDWKAAFPEHGDEAVVANGLVYAGHDRGMSVYPLACGTGGIVCDPLWVTDEDAQRGPVIMNDLVFAGSESVWAYPALGCGQLVCEPVLRLDVPGSVAWTITGAGDVVVVTGQTFSWDAAGLFVFDLSRCSGDVCEPTWTAKIGPHEAGSVAVARGSIYVGGDKNMFVFDLAGCGADVCKASWRGLTGRVGHADTTPTVADGFVYLLAAAVPPNDRSLSAFSANGCGNPTCKPNWAADAGGASGGQSLAVAYHTVWVTDYGQLDAFDSRGCEPKRFCDPQWVGKLSGLQSIPAPTVASDVVYTVVNGATVAAFATSCDSEVCQPLTKLHTDVGFANEVFVSNGKLVVSGSAGIEVFGLP
jgi:hypothetical protein